MEEVGARLYRRTFPFMLLDVGIVALLLMSHVNIFSPVIAIIAGLGSIGAVSYIILGAFRFRRLKPGGLQHAMTAFYVLCVLYVSVGVIDLAAAGLLGDTWLFIQSALVLLLARSSRRAPRAHRCSPWSRGSSRKASRAQSAGGPLQDSDRDGHEDRPHPAPDGAAHVLSAALGVLRQ